MEYSSQENEAGYSAKRSRRYSILILLAIFVFATLLSLSGQTGTISAQTDNQMLGVVGTYGDSVFVAFSDMTRVQLVDSVDFGSMVDGEERKNTMSGLYENDAFGTYTLHVYTERSPYIVLSYGNGNTLVFNQKTAKQTRSLYESLLKEGVPQ